MIEVITKEHEIQIYIDREKFRRWLGVTSNEVPWEAPTEDDVKANADAVTGDSTDDKGSSGSQTDASEPEGYKTGDGTTKEFPNPVEDKKTGDTDGSHVADNDIDEKRDGVDLFDSGPNGIGGTLQDDPKGKEKIKQLRDWLKERKYNYKNFCLFLHGLEEVGGFDLKAPVIGLTQKKEPTIFQLATRYHSYWMSAKDDIARDYETFLLAQLADMGISIQMVKDEFDGVEIDPKNLPKGVEVSV